MNLKIIKMTAKEKAKEIVIKMQFQKRALMFEDAKQCALIAVDEITTALTISTGHLLINKVDENELVKDFNYWNEVKTEIEKL